MPTGLLPRSVRQPHRLNARSRNSARMTAQAGRVARARVRRLAMVAAMLVLCGWLTPAGAQVIAGSVTSLSGSATLQRAGTGMAITIGMTVMVADELIVSESAKVTITLTDGSLLEAGSSTTIVIDQQLLESGGVRSSTRVRMLAGILRSVAKHSSHGNLPNFEVHTPNAILAARGTTFDTAYTQGQSRFGFGGCTQFTDERTHRGVVGVRNAASPDAAEVSVPAGYEATIACGAAPLSPGPLGMTGIPMSGGAALTTSEPGPGIAVPPPPPEEPGPMAPPPPPPSVHF